MLLLGAVTRRERALAEAIRNLRVHLEESQQAFSNRLGVAVRTVARYETEKPPRGTVLIQLAKIADEAARPDLKQVFVEAEENQRSIRSSSVAAAIRDLRAALGLTQQQLAHATGLAVSTIAIAETSKSPDRAVLKRLTEFAIEKKLPFFTFTFGKEVFPDLEIHLTDQPPANEILFSLEKPGDQRQLVPSVEENLVHRSVVPTELRAVVWLLDIAEERETLRRYLVGAIARVIARRGFGLKDGETNTLGELGEQAIADHAERIRRSGPEKGLK